MADSFGRCKIRRVRLEMPNFDALEIPEQIAKRPRRVRPFREKVREAMQKKYDEERLSSYRRADDPPCLPEHQCIRIRDDDTGTDEDTVDVTVSVEVTNPRSGETHSFDVTLPAVRHTKYYEGRCVPTHIAPDALDELLQERVGEGPCHTIDCTSLRLTFTRWSDTTKLEYGEGVEPKPDREEQRRSEGRKKIVNEIVPMLEKTFRAPEAFTCPGECTCCATEENKTSIFDVTIPLVVNSIAGGHLYTVLWTTLCTVTETRGRCHDGDGED